MSFNPNGLRVMEIDDERDILGKNWLAFWRGNIQDTAINALENAKKGELAKFEGYCPTFKGSMKYWEVSIAPLYDDYGDILWLLVISRDATKYKELEKKSLRQTEEIQMLLKKLKLARK
jgi:PAS domain-containing protein